METEFFEETKKLLWDEKEKKMSQKKLSDMLDSLNLLEGNYVMGNAVYEVMCYTENLRALLCALSDDADTINARILLKNK